MKTLKTLLVSTLLLGSMFGFTSCSDDDGPKNTPAAKTIEGSYSGDIEMTVLTQEFSFPAQTVKIVAVSDETVNIMMPSYGPDNMLLPEMTIENLEVIKSGDKCIIKETDFSMTLENGRQASGTVSASYENKILTLNFELYYGSMPIPMIASFVASKD